METGLKQKDVVLHAKGDRFLEVFVCTSFTYIWVETEKELGEEINWSLLHNSYHTQETPWTENICGPGKHYGTASEMCYSCSFQGMHLWLLLECGYCASCTLHPPWSDWILLFLKIYRTKHALFWRSFFWVTNHPIRFFKKKTSIC